MRDAGAAADERDQHNPAFLRPLQLCRPSVCHTFLEVTKDNEGVSQGESSLTKAHASNDHTDSCALPVLALAGGARDTGNPARHHQPHQCRERRRASAAGQVNDPQPVSQPEDIRLRPGTHHGCTNNGNLDLAKAPSPR